MKIDFSWHVPDDVTISDPNQQGPLVGTRGGVSGVIVAIPWALVGVSEDGTRLVTSMTTPIANADPTSETFKPFEQVTKDDLKNWLLSEPDGIGSLNKADQEQQLTARILEASAPAFPAKLGAVPVPPLAAETAGAPTVINTTTNNEERKP